MPMGVGGKNIWPEGKASYTIDERSSASGGSNSASSRIFSMAMAILEELTCE